MQVRNPGIPGDQPGEDHPTGDARRFRTGDASTPYSPAPGVVSFRVPTRILVAKFTLAAVLALACVLAGSGPQLVIGLLAAAAVTAYGLRDVVARERLRADGGGVVAVRGYAGRHHLPWAEVERVRVDGRMRFGARTDLLEVDAGADIYLFSRFDLGTDPDEALAAIETVRRRGQA